MPKILFITAHPTHVHQFKNLYKILQAYGWECLYISSMKGESENLINYYGIKFRRMYRSDSRSGKLISLIYNFIFFLSILQKERPDIIISRLSVFGAIATKILRIPHITYSDTEIAGKYNKIAAKYVEEVVTPIDFKDQLKDNQKRVNGYKELFYLHPKYFHPDAEVLKYLGLDEDDKFVLMRFVAFNAFHDYSYKSVGEKFKVELVETINKYAKIYISSEGKLPELLEKYRLTLPPERIHHLMAFSHLYIGESATMAMESALLGVPAIYINDAQFGATNEFVKSEMVYCYYLKNKYSAIKKAEELIKENKISTRPNEKVSKVIGECEEMNQYFIKLINNYV